LWKIVEDLKAKGWARGMLPKECVESVASAEGRLATAGLSGGLSALNAGTGCIGTQPQPWELCWVD